MSYGPYRIPNNRPYQLAFRLWQMAGAARLPIVLQSASGYLSSPSAGAALPPMPVPTTSAWNAGILQFAPTQTGGLAPGLWNGAAQLIDQLGLAYEVDFGINIFAGSAPAAGAAPAPGRSVDVVVDSGSIDVITLDAGPPGVPGPDLATSMYAAGLIVQPTVAAVAGYFAAQANPATNVPLSAEAQAAVAKLGQQPGNLDAAVIELASQLGRVLGIADLSDANQSGAAPAL